MDLDDQTLAAAVLRLPAARRYDRPEYWARRDHPCGPPAGPVLGAA